MPWAAAVFGWPGGLASIILSAFGLLIRRGSLVWVGAFVGLPFMFYLFLTPRFWWLAAIAGVDRRLDGLDDKISYQFVWLVGIQVTTPAAIVGALMAR